MSFTVEAHVAVKLVLKEKIHPKRNMVSEPQLGGWSPISYFKSATGQNSGHPQRKFGTPTDKHGHRVERDLCSA